MGESAAAAKSRILIVGATGYIGKYLVDASVSLGHPTFALVREGTAKTDLIEAFGNSGVTLIYGDIDDRERLVEAIKRVDVVISALRHEPQQLYHQLKIISAIKEAGNIKRYLPSEFGFDVGRLKIMEPAKTPLGIKAKIRQAIKDEGIPYTIICSHFASGYYFLSMIGQIGVMGPPTDKVFILGDGNSRVVFVKEEDTATYTIKSVDDPRALNKILYVKPPADIFSHNELVTFWEKKTGKTFERIYVPEEEVLKKIQELPPPHNFGYALAHAAFIKGEMTNFEIDPMIGAEASELYPEVKYTAVDEYLDRYM